MKLLAIETSCDETAVAIAVPHRKRVRILKSKVFSQVDTHAEFGGVVPEVAARQHLAKLIPMIEHFIGNDLHSVDAIAATIGPGLPPALRTGVEVAKTLAYTLEKPFVPISHLEGHLYANWIMPEGFVQRLRFNPPAFPALALLVSGGHTELILMKGHGEYELLGETLDDAAGEAFDKVAKMLELGYPGGPAIAKLAEHGNAEAFDFPRGLLNKPGYDFSFSGLKTSVLYTLRKNEEKLMHETFQANIAASFQEAVVDVLVKKTLRAIKQYSPKSFLLAGGVSANRALRARLYDSIPSEVSVHIPELRYCMDNAAMIAAAGVHRYLDGDTVNPLSAAADSQYSVFV
jgi:N6-L-threonylcarbamoyladenine synthase